MGQVRLCIKGVEARPHCCWSKRDDCEELLPRSPIHRGLSTCRLRRVTQQRAQAHVVDRRCVGRTQNENTSGQSSSTPVPPSWLAWLMKRKYSGSSGPWDLRELTFTPVVVKDRNALNAEIQEAQRSNKRLREDLKYIEKQYQLIFAAKVALEREVKELKEENQLLERPPGAADLEAVQPELLKCISKMGKLIGQVGKPDMRLYMVPATRRSDRTKRQRIAN